MKNNPFQLVLIIIFLAIGAVALLVFAGVIKIGGDKGTTGPKGTVVLWGTVSGEVMNPLIDKFNNENKEIEIKYRRQSADTFNQDLLEAIASGSGPDMFLLPDSLAQNYLNKISVIPYTSYPAANFRSVFATAGEVFMTSKGILAFPLIVDPLVMYYNKTQLDSNDIVYPPAYWDDFASLVPTLTKKEEASRQIINSATALGQFSNVTNAKAILSSLFMQAGNNIVSEISPGYFGSVLASLPGEKTGANLGPIISFYTSFADPLSSLYSWNKSLPNSDVFFTSDKLAFYFGFAGELNAIKGRNPNLNFGITSIPQIKNASSKVTKANVTGIAVSAFSKNPSAALSAATYLATNGSFAKDFSNALNIPPARRDLLLDRPTDIYGPVLYSSALFSKSWLDPDPVESNAVFRNLIDSVLANTTTPADAVVDASSKINLLLRR